MNYETALEIEIALVKYFNPHVCTILPNAYYALGFKYELDLLVISNRLHGVEVEIKVSKTDIVRDLKKKHCHDDPRLKHVYFAIPEILVPSIVHIPYHFGVLCVLRDGSVRKIRSAAVINSSYLFDPGEISEIFRLTYLRFWSAKEIIVNLTNNKLSSGSKLP